MKSQSMHHPLVFGLRPFVSALIVASCCLAGASPLQTQTINLQAGWNAVYLEVAPTNSRPEFLFSGLPMASAWAFQEKVRSVDFIQDPAEPVWNLERWAFYIPTNKLESAANRLSGILGNQPYLINMSNAAIWRVTGVPSLKRITWQADAYNLVGFPVDPAAPPTFQTFFRNSSAHYNTSTLQMQPVYRMASSGEWTQVAPTTTMKPGEVCWVFCKGGSTYQGPLEVLTETGDQIEFGELLDLQNIRVFNRASTLASVKWENVGGGSVNPLVYYRFDPTVGPQWPALTSPYILPITGGSNATLRVAVNRMLFPGTSFDTVISIGNGAGVRYLVPLTAAKSEQAALAAGGTPQAQSQGFAGLWIGSASVTDVNVAHSGILVTNGFDSQGRALVVERVGFDPTPKPVRTPAELRLLVHVDTNGTARLLKQVIQMWQEPVYTNDVSGVLYQSVAGRHVLLTDDTLVPQYTGVASRDTELAGRRFSSIAFDFPGTSLAFTGSFAYNQSLLTTNILPKSWPTNPFRHKYHPDHQSDASYDVVRVIGLRLKPATPDSPPDYGYRLLQGTYEETVSGLHKTNIFAAGTFTLQRVSSTGILNR